MTSYKLSNKEFAIFFLLNPSVNRQQCARFYKMQPFGYLMQTEDRSLFRVSTISLVI